MGDEDEKIDIGWLVRERSRIQRLSLDLLRVMAKKDEILPDSRFTDAVLLMVGAAFSLWRAIFLTHTSKTLDKNFDDASKFLRKVVRHNTIIYGDDIKMQAWSFGYYLNNCKFRLKSILDFLDLKFDGVDWLEEPLPIDADAQSEWTKHCDVLQLAVRNACERLHIECDEDPLK
jgi:hypothetical protein